MKLDSFQKITRSPKAIMSLFLIIVALTLLSSFYFYTKYQKTQAILDGPNKAAKEAVKSLIAKVGKHVELPSSEDPAIATVSDIEQLKNQPFFQKAENGDKVLIYTQAKKAYLYRPRVDKIIEIGPVMTQQETQTVAGSQSASTKVSGLEEESASKPAQFQRKQFNIKPAL